MKTLYALSIFVLFASCSNFDKNSEKEEKLLALEHELDSLKNTLAKTSFEAQSEITTFLTFQDGNAEEAMNFYVDIFENSKITEVRRFGAEGPAPEGSILMARFELNGSKFACSDSYVKHAWNFTPGVSNFVDCNSDKEMESLFGKLSEGGKVLMPLANYGFSEKFGFLEDKFGVSWQLNMN
ncbi:MAG: VOC family protein [Jejuia sp.]